jgi:hypothetical protein
MTSVLKFDESAGVDADRLAQIYSCYGDREADRLICDAMEDLALARARSARANACGDLAAIDRLASAMAAQGSQIGLPKIEKVATDVVRCVRVGDQTALQAVLARLSRVGDLSLSAVWDPRYRTV